MPSTPIQPTLDLVVKEAMADAEAAFLKTFLGTVSDGKTIGDLLGEIADLDIDYETLDHAQVQAVKGLLSIRVDQIKLDKPKKKAPAKKKSGRKSGRKKPQRPANDAGTEAAE